MSVSSIHSHPGAGISGFAPFADNAAAGSPAKTSDAVALVADHAVQPASKGAADPFAAVTRIARAPDTIDLASHALPAEADVGAARGKREASTTKFTIGLVDGPLSELLKNDEVRAELDKVVDGIKGMNVKGIEVKGYFPFFSEFGKMRAEAVKDFLVYRGVDEGLITVIGRGPGFASQDAPLAKARSVVVEINGSPKQDAAGAAGAQTRKPAVAYLMA